MLALLVATALALPPEAPRFLVFTKTTVFRHDSIPTAKRCMLDIAKKQGWSVTFTEDASWFSPHNLASFDGVVFALTTGDVLNDAQQNAMQAFIENGGGYLGIHAAADTEYDWPFYGKLVGAWFRSHPAIAEATVHVEDRKHPATNFLPETWKRRDEWYDYKSNPRGKVRVLATIDEKTYTGGLMGADHPIMWCQEIGKGRSFYTGFGHTSETYADELVVKMLTEALRWSVRAK